MPFKKGTSGNPKGRPPQAESITALLRAKLEAPKTLKDKRPRKEKIVEKLLELAELGDIHALRYVFDRIDGKPVESMELSNGSIDRRLEEIFNGRQCL